MPRYYDYSYKSNDNVACFGVGCSSLPYNRALWIVDLRMLVLVCFFPMRSSLHLTCYHELAQNQHCIVCNLYSH